MRQKTTMRGMGKSSLRKRDFITSLQDVDDAEVVYGWALNVRSLPARDCRLQHAIG